MGYVRNTYMYLPVVLAGPEGFCSGVVSSKSSRPAILASWWSDASVWWFLKGECQGSPRKSLPLIIEMLVADGMLPDWTGKQCPRCEKGQLSKLLQRPCRCGLKHRCNRKHCQMHMSPTHLHPWFMESNGTGATPLQTQAAVLLLKLQNTSLPSTCQMLAVNHKLAEDMSTRLIYARQDYVKAHQPKIQLGRRRVISGT